MTSDIFTNTMLVSIYVFHNPFTIESLQNNQHDNPPISNTIFHVETIPHHVTILKAHTYADISDTDVANKFFKQGVELHIIDHSPFHLIGNTTPY